MTASHSDGNDEYGNPRKQMWGPPEGSAPAPPEEKNPLIKLLMEVAISQETLLEDHILLTNRINIHRCSDHCLKSQKRIHKMWNGFWHKQKSWKRSEKLSCYSKR